MRTKWLSWSMAVALGMVAIAATALAQDRPVRVAPDVAREEVAEETREAPEMREMDDLEHLEDLGGLDLLLAADVAPGAGHGGAALHGGRGHGMGAGAGMRRGGPGGAELRQKLNLTDDQKSRIADIHDRQERAAIPVRGDLRIASLDLRKLMRADKPDQRAIDAQIDRLASLRATLHKARVATMLEARSVLTPAQQKLMREHRGGMMGHMREGRRPHGGGMRMRHL